MSSHDNPDLIPPVNKLPPAVLALFFPIAGLEAAFALGQAGLVGGPEAIGWRLGLVREMGFHGAILQEMLARGLYPLDHVMRILTYPFVHLSFTHSIFAMVLLLALGKMVTERMGSGAFLALFFGASLGGALGFAWLTGGQEWLVGAYPGVYGLIGGYSFVMWRALGAKGMSQAPAFTLIAMLMGLQLVWSIFAEIGTTWVADLTGFFVGFGLCFIVAPGEWRRLRARLRGRG